jgi:hypothetical protein
MYDITIEERPLTPALARLFEQAERNLLWFSEPAQELDVFTLHRGRFIAVSGGELLVGDSRAEVDRLARQKHSDEMPHIRFIPREKLSRI